MNQNRNQNRRRGRGGNRGQSGGNQGNRIDSRARGNAPQLLEKYKKLAHDASLNGDRVQTEYYLQFADHYFRVVADSRAQREDQRPRRDEREDRYDREDRDEREASFDEADEREEAEEAASGRRSRDEETASNEGTPGTEGEEIADEERNPFVRQGRGQRSRPRGRNRPANGPAAVGSTTFWGLVRAVIMPRMLGMRGSLICCCALATIGRFTSIISLPPSISREEEAPARPRTRSRRSRPADDGGEETLEAVG